MTRKQSHRTQRALERELFGAPREAPEAPRAREVFVPSHVGFDIETRDAIVRFALGRIFALMSRPTEPGDVERYEAARSAVLDALQR